MVVSEHTRFNRTCDPHFIESVVLCQHRGGCLRLSVSQESSMPCSPRAQMSPQGLNLSAHTSGIYLATWLGQQGGGRQVPKPTWSSQTTGWDCGSGSAPPEGCKWRRPETLPGWQCPQIPYREKCVLLGELLRAPAIPPGRAQLSLLFRSPCLGSCQQIQGPVTPLADPVPPRTLFKTKPKSPSSPRNSLLNLPWGLLSSPLANAFHIVI